MNDDARTSAKSKDPQSGMEVCELSLYGCERFGLGLTAMGAWITGAALLFLLSPAWGRLLLVAAAPLWFAMVAVTRRSYRLRGPVGSSAASSGSGSAQRWGSSRVKGLIALLLATGVFAVVELWSAEAWSGAEQLPKRFYSIAVGVCLVATGLLAWRLGRCVRDTTAPGPLLLATFLTRSPAFGPGDVALLIGLGGLFGVAKGVHEHRRYRQLVRPQGPERP